MEEASVTGESPDRSKQHESSAEPTSGSTAPVPGPASSGGGGSDARPTPGADPRLAVAREAVAVAKVDTATAVFSTRGVADVSASGASGTDASGSVASDTAGAEVLTAEGSPGREDSAAASEAEDAAESGANGSQSGDSRLRDAVAAWVAGAGAGAEGSGSGSGSGSGTGGRESRAGAESDGDVEGDGDAAPSADDGTAPEAGVGAEETRTDSEDGTDSGARMDSEDGTDSEAGSDSGEGSGSEPEEAVEVEGAASGTVEGAASGTVETRDDPSAGNAEPVDGGESKSGAEPSGTAPQEADAESSVEDVSGDAKGDRPVGGSEAESAEAVERLDGEAAGAADSGSGAESTAEDTPAGGRSVAAEEAEADAAPADEATPALGDEATSAPNADADAEPDSASAQDTDAKRDPRVGGGNVPAAGRDDDGEPGTGADEDERKRPVDQPTAAFKVRAPAVDQPTTTLKVGDAEPDEKTTGAEPESDDKPDEKPAAPERASERTSKFVALKPLDEPTPPKQKPAVAPEEKPAVPPAAETAAIAQVGPEQTAQQPLPPKPPLDLLAELTNTPPPPETPVRTIVRRVKIWTPLVLLLAAVFAVVQAVRPLPTPALTLTADESYAFEGDKFSLQWPGEGQGWMDVNGIGTMDSFGEQKAVPIGSVAKAMTAYVVLKDHPLKSGQEGPKITVDALAEKEGGYDKDGESTLNTVKKGDTLTEKQAIEAIMIPSANNIARLLARWDAGSEEAFVKKMNAAAKDLGMTNTTYTDSSGLKESTVSTAEDQVKLGNELVKMQALTDITRLPTWKDPSGREWQNYNRLVPYNDAIGIKTGSTTKAGGNLLFAATKEVGGETVTVVGAILGQHTPPIIDTVNAVSKTAMLAAQDALTSDKILKKGDVVGYADDQLGGHTPVVLTKDVTAVGWSGLKVELSFAADDVPHSAEAGTKVGTLTVGDGTGGAVEVPVALQTDLTEPGFTKKLTRLG